jgi:glutaredoxin 3
MQHSSMPSSHAIANQSSGGEPEAGAPQPHIRMYATAFCPYCVRARHLLEQKGVTWEEISVDNDRERFQEMTRLSNRVTVPQIFIGEVHVGGFDDMAALERAGKLDPLLGHA